jgi:pimeloyl-[acyl-carrier protein] synthase
MAAAVTLDWASPAFLADPYPFYHRLRAVEPVHRHESGFWLVTRYDDAVAMLRDRRFIRPSDLSPEDVESLTEQNRLTPRQFLWAYGILWRNPPDHTRLRRLLNKAFTPGVVDALRPEIQSIVEALLDAAREQGRLDLIPDLAYPLPVRVIAELLGVPLADRDTVREWSRDLVGAFDPARGPDAAERGNRAIESFMSYFSDVIVERRARPRDDLLSNLIAAQDAGEQLSDRELLANVIFLFVAGHETTVGLIGNGVLALLRHPDQLARLRDEAGLAASAVEELLRYDSPEQTIFWTVTENLEWGGKSIEPGQEVLILVGAVNRDAAQFPEPDRLDVARADNRHLAFSHGIHYCLGAPLARAQAQIAIPALIQRFPDMTLAGEPEWQRTFFIRELRSLPVSLR